MAKKSKTSVWEYCCSPGCCGWALLIIGLIWLAKELGWIKASFSMWPVILIVVGIYIIANRSKKRF